MKTQIIFLTFFLIFVKTSHGQELPQRCNETLIAIISSFSSQTNQYLSGHLLNTISALSVNLTRTNFIEVFKKNILMFRILQNNTNDRKLMVELTRDIFTFKNDFTWSVNEFCYGLENLDNLITKFTTGNSDNINKMLSSLYSNQPNPLDVFTVLYNDYFFKQIIDYLMKSDPIPMHYLLKMIGVQ